MINWTNIISVGLLTGVSVFILLLILKRNKKFYEKLNKYFHPDFVIILFAMFFIGNTINDYLREKDLSESLTASAIGFVFILIIDFLVKKFWKKK